MEYVEHGDTIKNTKKNIIQLISLLADAQEVINQ